MAKKKHTVYIPNDIFEDMQLLCDHQERSINWMIAHAWQVARPQIAGYASMNVLPVSERAESVH
ncbi:MAG: putative small protein (TIGR04563 family) [Bradymonadia bacterium]|jgi:uncharacterized small protein (TIGR04563 family)